MANIFPTTILTDLATALGDTVENITPAYIAGLFDGEGMVSATPRSGNTIDVELSITQTDPTVLHVVQRACHLGCVRVYRSRCGSVGRLRLRKRHDIQSFIESVLPYTIVKHDQLLLMRELLATPTYHRAHRSALAAAIRELKH